MTPGLRLLSLIQPAILLILAVLTGVGLAPKVGLASPAAEAAASGGNVAAALRPQLLPGIAGGLIGGAAIVLIAFLFTPFLPSAAAERISELGKFLPLPARILYGGITEEVLLRWGFMTLLVWLGWKIFQKGRDAPSSSVFTIAILISSLIFGIGHLPIAFLLFPEATLSLTFFVIVANSVFGLVAGFLYWKRGLESAVIAAHVGPYRHVHFQLFRRAYF